MTLNSRSTRGSAWLTTGLCACAAIALTASHAWAFDFAGYHAKLDAVVASVKAKSLGDGKAALAQLDELTAMGKAGAQEYAAREPKFAKLMAAAIAGADGMHSLTDEEIEDTWGENGSAGDPAGVPLKSLGQFDATRGYLELMVSPAHAYIYLKKWQSSHKQGMLDKTTDELAELAEHLKSVN